jgi:hypothetical protein
MTATRKAPLLGRTLTKAYRLDLVSLGQRGMKYERLDQLVNELLLGVH